MAEQGSGDDHEVEEENTLYKPPAKKELNEIINADADDPSLIEYKKKLLGSGLDGPVVVEPNNPNFVIVKKLGLLVDGRDELTLDLTGDKDAIKKTSFVLKEGCTYKVRIYFYVQREIVSGLRYKQKAYRAGIKLDQKNVMVGSYGPKPDLQSYTTPEDEAPSGMLARGEYKIDSLFTDDDKNEYLSWEWKLNIKKDWQ